jgi:hypothetical protein
LSRPQSNKMLWARLSLLAETIQDDSNTRPISNGQLLSFPRI